MLYELDGHVATITYNRPEALNPFARFRDEEAAWGAAAARDRRPPVWTGT